MHTGVLLLPLKLECNCFNALFGRFQRDKSDYLNYYW